MRDEAAREFRKGGKREGLGRRKIKANKRKEIKIKTQATKEHRSKA